MVYHLACVNKHVAERVSMFNVGLLFFISLFVENRRMSYAVAMNILIQTLVLQENPEDFSWYYFCCKKHTRFENAVL